MSIRAKIVLILLLTMTVLVIGTGIISRHLVMTSYGVHERYVLREATLRAAEVIEEELEHMEKTNLDWSNWDDTRLYMMGKALEYVEENMMNITFTNLGINMMILVDTNGEVVFGKSVDLDTGLESPLPTEFQDKLPGDGPIMQHGGVLKGIVPLERAQMLITARPILDSNGHGPSVGTLILGRWLDEDMRNYVAQVSRTHVNIREWTDTPLSDNGAMSTKEFSEGMVVRELGSNRIRGSLSIANIHNSGGIIIDVEMPREIMAKGKDTVAFFNIVLAALSIIFIVAAWVMLEVFVLRRVSVLHQVVSKITRSGDHEIRIPSQGNDELTGLAESINGMLEELYYSEKALGIILGVTRLPIIVMDREGVIKAWNLQAQEIIGWTAEEAKGRGDLIVDPGARSDFLQFVEFACSSPTMLTYECKAVRKNGTPFEAMVVASSADSPENEEDRIVMILIDVTVRKDAERALKATLDIQDTLLKEINHRIKNNLQAVSSVLELGILKLDDPLAASVIKDSQTRIYTMALVHERLYRSDNPREVDLRPYVQELVRNIASTFNKEGSAIGLQMDIQELKLNSETAVSCGLIINELVTNVFKYAYPSGRMGTMTLRLGEQEEGLYSLTVSDDGEGMPSEREGGSMGLSLVESLARQLDGSFEIASNGGTHVTVQFREAIEMSSFNA
jgi:PAS domain S-box-containing protein